MTRTLLHAVSTPWTAFFLIVTGALALVAILESLV